MALKKISVTDFQSIASAEVELGVRDSGGGLTTIVGPSSTGKSALLRAVRLLARNSASVSVRAGQKKTVITAEFTEHSVTVERGPGLSTYKLDNAIFAKSGVGVPDDIVKVLGLSEVVPDVHFASQFDKPYLVGETGSVISEVVGRLTNANVLRIAVREGGLRARRAKQLYDHRVADAQTLATEMKERYADLPAREEALVLAREAVATADAAKDRVTGLEGLLQSLTAARAGLQAAQAAQGRFVDITPALERAEKSLAALTSITALRTDKERAAALIETSTLLASQKGKEAAVADDEYHDVLHEAGTCPTCLRAFS